MPMQVVEGGERVLDTSLSSRVLTTGHAAEVQSWWAGLAITDEPSAIIALASAPARKALGFELATSLPARAVLHECGSPDRIACRRDYQRTESFSS